ncbi:sigma-70 family RNA polymerase sigma factor [Bradyrhizobium elkanii]|uniref:sigma-70 family RNA polymerase sigma factor n=1 Tax=Bradyrhizobium elkanii TaxID=29448 RepID=UPI0009BD534C|nr:sigma-70 family RNA polymerase sigma factor [Bradyrhizobium elkanii]
MKALSGDDITSSMATPSSCGDEPARARLRGDTDSPRHDRRKAARWERWNDCSERWGRLLLAARAGDGDAYERLLRELDLWLRAYYARRLPYPAADDARQEVLLAIHAKRHTFAASKPFGAWVTAIARYKWVDRVRDASRYSALALDEDIAIEDHEGAAISAAALDQLLGRLKPAQESVIRLVKLNGLSIARAAGATGQSAALVKINIHRGLKKLSTLVS